MRPSERAWAALAIAVVGYEVVAPKGELLSHAFDRFLERRPLLTWGATLIIAAHLLNVLPNRVDPIRPIHGISVHALREKFSGRS